MAESQDGKPRAIEVDNAPEEKTRLTVGGAARYLITRVPTLVPPMNKAPNPFKTLTLLNRQQWLFFLVCAPGLPASSFTKPRWSIHFSRTDVIPGRLCRLDMGCLRLLHRLPDGQRSGRGLWKVELGYHLGYHPRADAPFSRRHHLWYCFGPVGSQVAVCRQQHPVHHTRAWNGILPDL